MYALVSLLAVYRGIDIASRLAYQITVFALVCLYDSTKSYYFFSLLFLITYLSAIFGCYIFTFEAMKKHYEVQLFGVALFVP